MQLEKKMEQNRFWDKLQYLTYFLFITMAFKLMIFKCLHVTLFIYSLHRFLLFKTALFWEYHKFINMTYQHCGYHSHNSSPLTHAILSPQNGLFFPNWNPWSCFVLMYLGDSYQLHSSWLSSSPWSPSISRAAYLLAELNCCRDKKF